MRDTLLVRIAPAVSPAPKALPTRIQDAIWILMGIYGFMALGQHDKKT